MLAAAWRLETTVIDQALAVHLTVVVNYLDRWKREMNLIDYWAERAFLVGCACPARAARQR